MNKMKNDRRLPRPGKKKNIWAKLWSQKVLFLMLLPGLLFYIIFRYGPMGGLIVAFQQYNGYNGIMYSPWVGFKHFENLFRTRDFWLMFFNTLRTGVLQLVVCFPAPIIFALILNEIRQPKFKKVYQTISYLPNFLSVVIVCAIFMNLFSFDGLVSKFVTFFGGEAENFTTNKDFYDLIYHSSTIWASFGSGAIVYLAALAGVDQQLYEAAAIDGCSRFKMIWKITLPSILPTIVTMFLLQVGNVIRIAPDKALILMNAGNMDVADIFGSYVYRVGVQSAFGTSFGAAAGMFESVLAAVILLTTNAIARKKTGTSLW